MSRSRNNNHSWFDRRNGNSKEDRRNVILARRDLEQQLTEANNVDATSVAIKVIEKTAVGILSRKIEMPLGIEIMVRTHHSRKGRFYYRRREMYHAHWEHIRHLMVLAQTEGHLNSDRTFSSSVM